MRLYHAVFAVVAGAAAAGVHAQSSGATEPANTIGLRTGIEDLSNGSQDWRETTLQATHAFGKRHLLELGLTRTERFGLSDSQFAVAYTRPLTPGLAASVEANASSTHRVLARHAYGASLQYEFAPAWLLHAGLRTTRYDEVRVNQAALMLERYVGAFSWAAGWRPSRAFGTTAHGLELRGSYYYGERNSIGLIIAGGKEAANIGGAVVLTSLRSAALVGRHWLNRDWALNYSAGYARQGDFYHRNGVGVGVQYAF